MRFLLRTTLQVAVTAVVLVSASAKADNYYYDGDTIVPLQPSSSKIAVQPDTTQIAIQTDAFFATHPCLEPSSGVQYLHRGFSIYGLKPSCGGYLAARADLLSDPAVGRVVPVYVGPTDSSELKVTDLVTVQFDLSLPTSTLLGLIAANGLRFVDSTPWTHNRWLCALDDTATGSPLDYGNRMHGLPAIDWACASFYSKWVPASLPTDPYFQYQYYLRNTGQTGGLPDADIDADSAWLVPLGSPVIVAVIDDGVTSHKDLPASRILPGLDVVGQNWLYPVYDLDASPGLYTAHGMACAGIIAASLNDTGIVGVYPGCRILPVKIADDAGIYTDQDWNIHNAIMFAAGAGARVLSCSWASGDRYPHPDVSGAIKLVTKPDPLGRWTRGCVAVFAAGNTAEIPKEEPVHLPASMGEVIAVGASDKRDVIWSYSCYDSTLDVVAPTGDFWWPPLRKGDQWTVDQMGNLGDNPHNTAYYGDTPDSHYTKFFGGTSGATPQVAGIAAMILSHRSDFYTDNRYRDTLPQMIRHIIEGSADDKGTPGRDIYYGSGRVNAYRALLSLCNCPHQGDINADLAIDVFDVNGVIGIAFSGDPDIQDPMCPTSRGDVDRVNSPGVVDVMDVGKIVDIAFGGGAADDPCAP